MSYNIRPCRSCKVIVECDASGICYECWCDADAKDQEDEEFENMRSNAIELKYGEEEE